MPLSVHVSPVAKRKRGRRALAAVLMALVPLVAGVWYFAYNVGAVSLHITDDAIDEFESLNLTFSEAAVHSTGALTATSWVALDLEATTVDLTDLDNNITALIGFDKVPAGKYTQARILVTSAVGVLKTGEVVSVVVPGGELMTVNPFDLEPQGSVSITMRLHVVQTGQAYHLEPVLGSVLGA